MKIGLYNLEPKIVNTAMMQVSTYHKSKGDDVEIYSPIFQYDQIYAFSLFDFTDKSYVKDSMTKGGTGFDITSRLPEYIEGCDYDWSLYPHCDYSIVWFSRGCIRNCPFCVVHDKEGMIHPVEPKNLNPNGEFIKVQDNNFFANPKWKDAIKQLKEWDQPVDLAGVDARILNKEMCEAISALNKKRSKDRSTIIKVKIAWDNPKDDLVPKLKEITKYVKPYIFMCYVLIGFDSTPEEDLYRVEELRKLKIDPFVSTYNKRDRYQMNFARWVNRKEIFKSVKWENYKQT